MDAKWKICFKNGNEKRKRNSLIFTSVYSILLAEMAMEEENNSCSLRIAMDWITKVQKNHGGTKGN